MKKFSLAISFIMAGVFARSTNYFVDGDNGNDALNSGLSANNAYKTIQKAANLTFPGDTVFIMNGLYTSAGNVLNINRSGDANAQVVYTNYPGHLPKLQASATSYAVVGFSAGTSYITVSGLEISGYGVNLSLAADSAAAKAQLVCPTTGSPATSQIALQKYNGHGITGDSRAVAIGTHHIVIRNNIVHDNCAAGIGFLKCDYVTIENNRVYNNSWYTIYGTSGISFNQCYNYDNNTSTYKIIVRNNISYGNRMYVPFYNDCKVTDGNGIILDIPLIEYNGRSLVANNICFNNGGSGIHSFKMNHVDILHNISYLNSASPEINSSNIYALQCDDIKIMNNIIVARPGKRMNGINATTNLVYDYNMFSGGASYELVGTHSILQDPKFVNASVDPAVADFHLQPGSLAVNAGSNLNSYPTDYAGNPRPLSGIVDIGAFESDYAPTAACIVGGGSLVLSNGQGSGTGEASAGTLYAFADTKPSVSGQKSRKGIVYPAALLSAIPSNNVITSLKFRRAIQISPANTAPSAELLPPNGAFRVYLRNQPADNLGAGALDWNSIVPETDPLTSLVYGGDAASIVGNSGGWKEIILQVPFAYTGGNLAVFVEYIQNSSVTGATDINWIYDNSGTQPLYSTANYPNQVNGFKSTSATGNTAVGTSLATTNERRPVITISHCSNGLLPVTWLRFTAARKENGVLVNWTTATEHNNAGFEVQRSANGAVFETIGRQSSRAINGSGTQMQEYQFTDSRPLPGTGYYRLLQKDLDGKITYSAVIAVALSRKVENTLTIYPNPAGPVIYAIVETIAASQSAKLQIQDISGKTIIRETRTLVPGVNNAKINAGKLAAGTYLLVVQLQDGDRLIQRFVKN